MAFKYRQPPRARKKALREPDSEFSGHFKEIRIEAVGLGKF